MAHKDLLVFLLQLLEEVGVEYADSLRMDLPGIQIDMNRTLDDSRPYSLR